MKVQRLLYKRIQMLYFKFNLKLIKYFFFYFFSCNSWRSSRSSICCISCDAVDLSYEEEGWGKLCSGGAQTSKCLIPETGQSWGVLCIVRETWPSVSLPSVPMIGEPVGESYNPGFHLGWGVYLFLDHSYLKCDIIKCCQIWILHQPLEVENVLNVWLLRHPFF